MPSYNHVTLLGNLTRDPELRYTPKGTAVARVGLAVNRNWTDESGEKKQETTFVDVDCWGRTAEVASQYLRKGDPALFAGRLQLDQWVDRQTNEKRSKLKVVASSLQLLGRRDGASAAPAPQGSSRAEAAQPDAPDDPGQYAPDDDNVPF